MGGRNIKWLKILNVFLLTFNYFDVEYKAISWNCCDYLHDTDIRWVVAMDFNYYIFIPKPKSSDRDLDPSKNNYLFKENKREVVAFIDTISLF